MHLVLLKTKAPLSAEAETHIHSLKAIAGVKSISCGPNYTTRGQGYNYAIAVTFDSKASESAYQTHPLHVEVRDQTIKPSLDTAATAPVCAIDYEYDAPSGGSYMTIMGLGFAAVACFAAGFAQMLK